MTPSPAPAQVQTDTGLSIGELSRRTTVEPATLRAWEQRHGFPVAQRTPSGHRRYAVESVAQVAEVLRRRAGGTRLEQAIAQTLAATVDERAPGGDSVFAHLRNRHPQLAPLRLRKGTLLGLTWAIEDECAASARRGDLFGAFQEEPYFEQSRQRWAGLAKLSGTAWAYAGFGAQTPDRQDGVVRVPLTGSDPMRREWAVVCDTPDLPVAVSAWELPGQSTTRDRDRQFEAVWTIDPDAVRDASRVCGRVAVGAHAPGAQALVDRLAQPVSTTVPDVAAAYRLFSRVLTYVDRGAA